jgi:hypothetical protein
VQCFRRGGDRAASAAVFGVAFRGRCGSTLKRTTGLRAVRPLTAKKRTLINSFRLRGLAFNAGRGPVLQVGS